MQWNTAKPMVILRFLKKKKKAMTITVFCVTGEIHTCYVQQKAITLYCINDQRDALFLYNQFYSTVFVLHVSNESSRSSSGARHNILYYTIGTIGTIVQASLGRLACTIYQTVLIHSRLQKFPA